jgi:P-type Ca2+ transporter type 2C
MGFSGIDVARGTADLISTGATELVLFTLALLTGIPLPLIALQMLWLNLVTNGIQDVAFAFELGEGDKLRHSPRLPQEPIFNRIMVERVVILALVIGTVTFVVFQWLIARALT